MSFHPPTNFSSPDYQPDINVSFINVSTYQRILRIYQGTLEDFRFQSHKTISSSPKFQEYSVSAGAFHFDVEILNDYITVCSECGIIRKKEQVFQLFRVDEVALKWTYVAVSSYWVSKNHPEKSEWGSRASWFGYKNSLLPICREAFSRFNPPFHDIPNYSGAPIWKFASNLEKQCLMAEMNIGSCTTSAESWTHRKSALYSIQ